MRNDGDENAARIRLTALDQAVDGNARVAQHRRAEVAGGVGREDRAAKALLHEEGQRARVEYPLTDMGGELGLPFFAQSMYMIADGLGVAIDEITALFGLSNRMANLVSMQPNPEFFLMGRVPKAAKG